MDDHPKEMSRRNSQGSIDLSDLTNQLESGLKDLEAHYGRVEVRPISATAADAILEPLKPIPSILDSLYVQHHFAEERAKWNRLAKLAPIKYVLTQIGEERSEKVATFMSKAVGLPSLLDHLTAKNSLLFKAGSGLATYGGFKLLAPDFVNNLLHNVENMTGLSHAHAAMGTGLLMVIAAHSVYAQIQSALLRQSLTIHDKVSPAIAEKANRMRTALGDGWKSWLPKAVWLGLDKIFNPHPSLSERTLNTLWTGKLSGPAYEAIPKAEREAVEAVTKNLTDRFSFSPTTAPSIAAELLANEEPNPNRLISILNTRRFPQEWVSRYGFDPTLCTEPRLPTPVSYPETIEPGM